MSSNIHPTAVVDKGAKIDPSAKIGPYAIIGPDVVIGAGCEIGPHAVVEHCHMGKDNKLHAGCFVGVAPQDLKYAGEATLLVMGDKNVVRECVTLNRGTAAHGETKIGSNCLFMAYSHVGHDCTLGNGVILVNSVALAGHVTIGDFTVVGGLAAIHQFQTIGKFCMIGGGSMINKDLPDFCTCQGYPAALRGLNTLGMRRAGVSRESMGQVKDAYKTLFLSGLRLEEALAQLKASNPGPEVAGMVSFIERSKRGVMRPAVGAAAEEEAGV
jgi:UDP-N-acetylglucosamine acyltransferase